MLISQDVVRRDMLQVKDGPDSEAIPLMGELLKYGRSHSDVVILEGIMRADFRRKRSGEHRGRYLRGRRKKNSMLQ